MEDKSCVTKDSLGRETDLLDLLSWIDGRLWSSSKPSLTNL